MNKLCLRVLSAGVCVLLLACEKPTPFEITTPAVPGGNTPTPMFDASLPSLDASMRPSRDGALDELPSGAFTQGALLKAIGDCALDRYRKFVPLAMSLRAATRAYADSLSGAALASAKDAWLAADASWQELELFRFGPAGSSALPGGADLRNSVYYFPDLNNCSVDLALVNRAYAMGVSALSVSGRGLGALEYLLFYAGDANSCAAGTTINTAVGGGSSPWQALSAEERTRRRAEYAALLGEDLLAQANALVAGWDPAQGDFLTKFASAGAGSSLFARAFDAFNVVDDAMWYLDVEVKDYKLAIPAGLSPVCMPGPCPQLVESRFSVMSNANLRANLSGFRLLFNGCGANYTGLGFDDWLRAIDRAD
ncbi:MAG TPA: imelysin family protein, partial [Polyangiales bacterium]